jgi:circadian clock protein KaiB
MTEAAVGPKPELTLFVSGASDLSARAIADATELCDVRLAGRVRLSVVDVHEDPAAVLRHGVRAAPTLVRTWPLPQRRFIGDLSQPDQVLLRLELAVAEPEAPDATDVAS